MNNKRGCYHGYRFPPEIISHAVWLYHRFSLSFRDVEVLLAERGIVVSYETIRQWCRKLGPHYARNLRRRQGRLRDIWHLDEVFGEHGVSRYHHRSPWPVCFAKCFLDRAMRGAHNDVTG